MEFVLLFNETADDFAQRTDPQRASDYWGAWTAYIGAVNQAGVVRGGSGLQPPLTATRVQIRAGERQILDGPYPDTKEHLAGFLQIEVPDLDAALEWAARSPCASTGHTEVRPVMPPMNRA